MSGKRAQSVGTRPQAAVARSDDRRGDGWRRAADRARVDHQSDTRHPAALGGRLGLLAFVVAALILSAALLAALIAAAIARALLASRLGLGLRRRLGLGLGSRFRT